MTKKRISRRDYNISRWSVEDAGFGGYIKLEFNPMEDQIDITYTQHTQAEAQDMISFNNDHLEEFINDLIHFKKCIDAVKAIPDEQTANDLPKTN